MIVTRYVSMSETDWFQTMSICLGTLSLPSANSGNHGKRHGARRPPHVSPLVFEVLDVRGSQDPDYPTLEARGARRGTTRRGTRPATWRTATRTDALRCGRRDGGFNKDWNMMWSDWNRPRKSDEICCLNLNLAPVIQLLPMTARLQRPCRSKFPKAVRS